MKVGRVTVSDRAHAGIYADASGPEIENALSAGLGMPLEFLAVVVPDEQSRIESALTDFCDREACHLVVTTGGTGISPRDVTPEATRAVIERELPGFSEAMRMQSLSRVRTAILSRAVCGVRGQSLIINLPGKPSAVRECLDILSPAIREGVLHLRDVPLH